MMREDILLICKAVCKRLPNDYRSIFSYAWISSIDDRSITLRYPYPPEEEALEFTKFLILSRPDIEKAFKKVLDCSISVKFAYFDPEHLQQIIKEKLEDLETSSCTSLPVPVVVLPSRG
jgi:hypothetical protein